MGASHGTLATSGGGGDEPPPELDGPLSGYGMDQHLFPGSGRMMRSFRLKNQHNSATVVLKSMWVTEQQASIVDEQEKELLKIRERLRGQPHVAPFQYWFLGNYRPRGNLSVRQISMLRPHVYTTLSDRLAARPFLTHVEKLWIVYQLLQALDAMHAKGVVHGFLTAENVGLSSWNWVVLVDVSSYKARTALPDDDPSEYVYYFQELYNQHGTDTTPREKRCYLAPERFYTPNIEKTREKPKNQVALTPSMDIFSAGCVIMETFLNGERALDLGDLMEYRKKGSSQTLQQKLNKIEFSSLRAACRHMLHLDPAERLSAGAYLDRLRASELVPESFATLSSMMERVTFATQDARLALAAVQYPKIMWEALGRKDPDGASFVTRALGSTLMREEGNNGDDPKDTDRSVTVPEEKKEEVLSSGEDIFAETEALLRKLGSMDTEKDDASPSPRGKAVSNTSPLDNKDPIQERTIMAKSSLLVYLQLIVSTVHHLQRPASKLVALQLMKQVGKFGTDEAKLQRIVPAAVSLLQDHDPLVRATAIEVLTSTISSVEAFPPSDSKVFPQYIFKRITHMITDPSLVVRLAFAKNIAGLAETAQRFLDISHAVRLYEAIGGGGARSGNLSLTPSAEDIGDDVFADDVTQLLGDLETKKRKKSKNRIATSAGADGSSDTNALPAENILVNNTYAAELSQLQEVVSRWVMHITTDQSEHSSPTKRALLAELPRLCNFFGSDGVMAFILPQMLSFLNDRKDWQLRSALFQSLPSVCHIIGRASTEHFVLPCLETALVDSEECVVSEALQCLSVLLRCGLLTPSVLVGVGTPESANCILPKYSALLVHPSADVRFFAVTAVNALCESIGSPDAEVFVVPILSPFLRFRASMKNLCTRQDLEKCLRSPLSRKQFDDELVRLTLDAQTPTSGQWMAVSVNSIGKNDRSETEHGKVEDEIHETSSESLFDKSVKSYLRILVRHRKFHSNGPIPLASKRQLDHAIDGSLKLAQQIKFPRQNVPGLPSSGLPSWYGKLREVNESLGRHVSESASIRSVSALGQVYGLSIMEQSTSPGIERSMTEDGAIQVLTSPESRRIDGACTGEWGAETCLDPTLTDTSLLVTKLIALQVPTLPPKLTSQRELLLSTPVSGPSKANTREEKKYSHDFRSSVGTLLATSRCNPTTGHTGAVVRLVVSPDQRFFVTGSHDGTCCTWDLKKAESCNGVLEKSNTYNGHTAKTATPRVNDLSMVEGGHSVVSGDSDGCVNVWRVDLVAGTKSSLQNNNLRDSARIAGNSEVRKSHVGEGGILALNHFNTTSASVLLYATQKGSIHSWDLRCAQQPFTLHSPPDAGYISSMATGSDRNWVVTGTNRGFIAFWDLRFQQMLKLWHHSRSSEITRLATSFVPPPQHWSGRGAGSREAFPHLFAACGPNECAMFNVLSGKCHECFRTVDYGSRTGTDRLADMPRLEDVPLSASRRRNALLAGGYSCGLKDRMGLSASSLNAMVGSIGASDQSFLITGGSDRRIRFWDFNSPSKCYLSGCAQDGEPRPTFERTDYTSESRLMLCRQPSPMSSERKSSSLQAEQALHQDSILDLKVVRSGLLSCSRDCTVKLWR